MKYCHSCNRISTGDAFFCSSCGRTFDSKLCPRLHVNPRSADVCSQCGSRDLSTPEPRVPLWVQILERLLNIIPGVFLLTFSVLLAVAFVRALLTNLEVLGQFLVLTLVLGIFWFLYTRLPRFVRRGIQRKVRRSWKRRRQVEHR